MLCLAVEWLSVISFHDFFDQMVSSFLIWFDTYRMWHTVCDIPSLKGLHQQAFVWAILKWDQMIPSVPFQGMELSFQQEIFFVFLNANLFDIFWDLPELNEVISFQLDFETRHCYDDGHIEILSITTQIKPQNTIKSTKHHRKIRLFSKKTFAF